MKRELGIGAALLLVGSTGVFAQGNKPAAAPAAKAPVASSPAASTNVPAANAPATSASAAATPATGAAKSVAVRVPSGGDYSAYIQEAPGAAPRKVADKADLEVPASLGKYTIYVLDMKSGYAARKAVDAKSAPAEVSFASPDFNLVQKVRVLATGKEGKPIAQGTVTLTDSGNNTVRGIIQPSSQGAAEFSFVKSGSGKIAVTAGEGAENTTIQKDVSIDLPKNETVQSVTLELPGVTKVVEPPASQAAPAANAPAANAPAAAPAAAPPAAAAPPPAAPPAAAPVQATPIERTQPSLTDTIGNFVVGLIQFAILIALLFFGYRYAKKQGLTVETVLKKMGVQPETVGAGGASLAGANLSGSVAAPGPAPAPPPVVADPNQCPFCGQMKDPSGGCACTVTRGATAGAAMGGGFGGGSSASGSGPRLVAMGGAYLGQVFPIQGAAIIGRDASNPIPLDRDTTASRRHAQITDQGGIYRIQDLGSSNGTYVNGAKITETQLSPGDEVAIGGTRFRFEV
jgi:hypothetical protein